MNGYTLIHRPTKSTCVLSSKMAVEAFLASAADASEWDVLL